MKAQIKDPNNNNKNNKYCINIFYRVSLLTAVLSWLLVFFMSSVGNILTYSKKFCIRHQPLLDCYIQQQLGCRVGGNESLCKSGSLTTVLKYSGPGGYFCSSSSQLFSWGKWGGCGLVFSQRSVLLVVLPVNDQDLSNQKAADILWVLFVIAHMTVATCEGTHSLMNFFSFGNTILL